MKSTENFCRVLACPSAPDHPQHLVFLESWEFFSLPTVASKSKISIYDSIINQARQTMKSSEAIPETE
jgi:hypothetical protein